MIFRNFFFKSFIFSGTSAHYSCFSFGVYTHFMHVHFCNSSTLEPQIKVYHTLHNVTSIACLLLMNPSLYCPTSPNMKHVHDKLSKNFTKNTSKGTQNSQERTNREEREELSHIKQQAVRCETPTFPFILLLMILRAFLLDNLERIL